MTPAPAHARSGVPRSSLARPVMQVLRATVWGACGLLVAAVIASGALWWWAGAEGSLATALGWVGQLQPVVATGATGSVRSRGHIGTLTWQQGGLLVNADDVRVHWQPLGLLQGKLIVNELAVGKLVIDDQRPPAAAVPSRPPTSLRLPLQVVLNAFSARSVSFRTAGQQATAETTFVATNTAGRYAFDGFTHTLSLANIQVAEGAYQASVSLLAQAPMTLDARLDGTLQARLRPSGPTRHAPSSSPITLPLQAQLTARGALTDLVLEAAVQLTQSPAAGNTAAAVKAAALAPQARAKARVMLWADQPIPQADVTFHDLDLSVVVPNAPMTQLTGSASVQPVALLPLPPNAPAVATAGAWAAKLQLTNALPGPWDQQRLPLEQLSAAGQWQRGKAVVESLKAQLGGGQLLASGLWAAAQPAAAASPAASAASTAADAAPTWQLQAALRSINPALLHTALAPFPVTGSAAVQTRATAVGFDIRLAGAERAVATTPQPQPTPAGQKSSHRLQANAELRLRHANATGSWAPHVAGGSLTLSKLQVRTNNAALTGELTVQPAARAGKGELNFTAPGLAAYIQGVLGPTSGKGQASLRSANAAALLAWLRTLPGLPEAVMTATATGSAEWAGNWAGGWHDPALTAQLDVPELNIRTAPASRATPAAGRLTTAVATARPAAADGAATPGLLKIKALQARLSGRLSQAQLTAQGQVAIDQRRLRLQLAAEAGRSAVGATLATSSWHGVLKQLSVSLEDPALGSREHAAGATSPPAHNAWTLVTRGPVSFKWLPLTRWAAAGGLQSSAGELLLTAPAVSDASAPIAPAVIAWQPVRWRPNALVSAGSITALPLAWAEVLTGQQGLANGGSGMSGDLLFNGQWDALLTDTLRLKARLARASGDLVVKAHSAQGLGSAGSAGSAFTAGVRQAEVVISNDGEVLSAALRWDSERAGSAVGQLTTRLARAPTSAATPAHVSLPATATATTSIGGWIWPDSAPLAGQLRAQLPKVGVWSVLAPPGWRLRGSLAAEFAVRGTRGAPLLSGSLQAHDMALRSVVDGFELGNGKLRARLDGTRLLIDELTLYGAGGPTGGGLLAATGEAALANGQPQVTLNATLTRLRASIRSDRQLTVSGRVQAQLKGAAAEVSGKLTVDQALIVLPDESTPQRGVDVVVRQSVAPTARHTAADTADADLPVQTAAQSRAVKLAVELELGEHFRVQGKGIDTQIRGSLGISSEPSRGPQLVGTLNTVGGQYRAYGQRLNVEQGVLRFTGAVDNPTLDILALRADAIEVSQRVGVQINGTALLPRIRLYAQPELADADKLSWLLTGKPVAADGAQAALLQQAALALLGSQTGGTSSTIASFLGLDELSFKGGSSQADGSTSQAAVTLGKRFSRNFYAAYERSVSGALGTLYVFYDLSRRFTVRAQAGQQSAVDLIYTVHYD